MSIVRSKKFEKVINGLDKFTLFRRGIAEHYLEVREALEPHRYENYLIWINKQISDNLGYLSERDIGFTDLKGVFTKTPKTSLSKELLWISSRIKFEARKINEFRKLNEEIETFFISGNYTECINLIDKVNSTFGYSLWSIQLRICVENYYNGLEAQKKYTSEVRSQFRQGLLNFISYHTSVRNEEKTTTQKFKDDINKRIENHKYFEPFVKTFTKYKLTNEIPDSQDGLAEVLWVSQSHSILDIYESFIDVLQKIIMDDLSYELKNVLFIALDKLNNINDFRLEKIKLHLNNGNFLLSVKRRDTDFLNNLIDKNPKETIRKFLKYKDPESAKNFDVWSFVYCAVAYANYDINLKKSGKNIPVPKILGKILQREHLSTESFTFLEKLSINLSGICTGKGLTEFITQLKKKNVNQDYKPWIVSLHSPYFGLEDFKDASYFSYHSPQNNNTYFAYSCFHGLSSIDRVEDIPISLFNAMYYVQSGDYFNAKEIINRIKSSEELKSIGTFVSAMDVNVNFNTHNRTGLIRVISREASRSGLAKSILPIKSTLESLTYDDLSELGLSLSSVICLHFLWLETYSEERESEIRFCINQLLVKYGCNRPSQLVDKKEQFDCYEMVYFLKEICKPFFLDSLRRVLKNDSDILSERQEICASLRFIDTNNSSVYADEIIAITNQQALDEGRRIVDTTRIYVDLDGLNRWANDELFEDYARFRDLLDVNLDIEKHFDELMDDIIHDKTISKNKILSQDESDVVLLDIFSRLSDEFLNNSVFGLDFYLSKRIRHQSFIGLIRGPLEFSHIITTKDTENGIYLNNTYWMNQFSFLDNKSQNEASEIFTTFSEKFDTILLAAKDKKFHILSKEYPEGLIYPSYNENLLEMIRLVPRMEQSDLLDDFLLLAYPLLWDSLEPSLLNARNYIDINLKNNISKLIEELKSKVLSLTLINSAQKDFIATLNDASSKVQLSLEEAKNWFKRKNDSELNKKLFALDQVVKIATESALKCQKSFHPTISNNIENGDVLLTASALVFVHDVLFVALDNARAHSGLVKPTVNIAANNITDDKKLVLKITSSASWLNRSSNTRKINDIKSAIASNSYGSRSKREGKSGFIKIAAVVKQSNKGTIDFKFDEHGNFVLEVTYSLLIRQVSKEEVEYA